MKILVIGGGGREHALAWKLARAGHEVLGAPGNPGIAREGRVFATDRYLDLAREQQVALTVVGPEAPLAAGVADEFRAAGLPIVGPTRACAQLEASKVYSKAFMERTGIPTARAVRAETAAEAREALRAFPLPVVVKADGLAAGKGVIIAATAAEADAAIGQLGPRLVIEEFLAGEEVSFIALCDGKHVLPLEATQDHKRIFDGDTGPNTGGMGAYCDGRILTPAQADRIVDRILEPAVAATGFTGFLYAGLMMTAEGPKVLEFNVRLGDPETQVLMHRLDSDFAPALEASTRGALNGVRLRWKPEPSVCVVLSAAGYPGAPRAGDPITGIDEAPGVVFHAGTRETAQGLVTAGGRVLGVTAAGATLPLAIEAAYRAVEKIHFAGMHYRRDIGRKGLARW
jgi:phosphoribosylamine--glycine ligase